MTVVQVDGQNVEPVTIDEFRCSPGETYDVIITHSDCRRVALLVLADSTDEMKMDFSGMEHTLDDNQHNDDHDHKHE